MTPAHLNMWLNIATLLLGGGALGIILRHRLGWRKLTLDSEGEIRDHYAKEVARLTEKLNEQSSAFRKDLVELEQHWRAMLAEAEKRHDECLKDRDNLLNRVNQLEDELRGLIRVITQASIDRVLHLPSTEPLSDDIREAAARVEKIITERGRA